MHLLRAQLFSYWIKGWAQGRCPTCSDVIDLAFRYFWILVDSEHGHQLKRCGFKSRSIADKGVKSYYNDYYNECTHNSDSDGEKTIVAKYDTSKNNWKNIFGCTHWHVSTVVYKWWHLAVAIHKTTKNSFLYTNVLCHQFFGRKTTDGISCVPLCISNTQKCLDPKMISKRGDFIQAYILHRNRFLPDRQ
jgi:hypothetical protein